MTRHHSDDCNSFEVDGATLWLRVTRIGSAWAFHACTDGEWWCLLRYFTLAGSDAPAADQVKIGFLAQSPRGAGCAAVFDSVRYALGAPADLRDGS